MDRVGQLGGRAGREDLQACMIANAPARGSFMETKSVTSNESAIDASFDLIDEPRLVRLVTRAPVSLQGFLKAGRAAHDHCVARKCDALLWDIRGSAGTFALMDRFYLAEGCAKFWRRQLKVSFLGRPDHMLPDRFGQTVAQNRGIQIQVFVEEKPALDWLANG